MTDFWLYFTLGLNHVLDIKGYDHVLFLIALTVPYTFKDWRNVLLMVTLFTIGHTLSLVLSVYGILTINSVVIEFLIPVTILIMALHSIYNAGKKNTTTQSINFLAFTTLFFGIIHGLGFSNYFKVIVDQNSDEKLLPLLEFALGIEAAQLIVVVAVLILSFVLQRFFKVQRRDWLLVTSAFVVGVVLPMIIESDIWK